MNAVWSCVAHAMRNARCLNELWYHGMVSLQRSLSDLLGIMKSIGRFVPMGWGPEHLYDKLP